MFKRITSIALLSAMAAQSYAASDLVRLAWTDDPSTTATIGWRQISGSDARIEYGRSADKSDWTNHAVDKTTSMQHPDDDVSLDTELAMLKGLSPDTAYYFQICDSEGCSDTRWFKTAPDSAEKFSFVAGGDSRTNSEPRRLGNQLVAKIRPLFVLFNGDFTDDGTHDQWQRWLEDWQLSESEDGRIFPIVATHGNHENDVVDMLSLIFGIPETAYYKLSVGGDMMEIFTLNTETEPGVGYGAYSKQDDSIWKAQNEQFAEDANASEATWLIGNYHRPMRPHTSGKTEGLGRIDAWAKTFSDAGFDLIIESDTHLSKYTFPVVYSDEAGSYESFKRDDANGTMLIGEGSWGAPTRPTDDDKPWTMDSASFWQFKLVHASEEQLDIRTVRFGSEAEQVAGLMLDTDSISALSEAEQEANAFALPKGLPLWQPLSGEVISLPASGFAGADIDNLQLIGSGSSWSYLDDGSSPKLWNSADFDASAWKIGAAQLGYGDGDEKTVLAFGDDENNKFTTTYFRQSFELDDASKVIKLTARLLRDDGAVLYINGREALRSNMPAGEISSASFAANGIGGDAESTYYEYFIQPELLKDGENLVAVEVHQADASSSDLSFDLDLTAVVSNVDTPAAESSTTLEAKPLSISEIELSWNDSEDFNEVAYQLERKSPGGDWQILTWRIDANTGSYIDSKLAEGQRYSYRIRPFNASGFTTSSNEVESATLANATPLVYFQDFSLAEFGDFTSFSASSNADWEVRDYNDNFYAYNNGYGADEASDDWLISPALPIGYYDNASLHFDSAFNYGGPLLELKYSANYRGSGDPGSATWISIPECKDASDKFCWNEPSSGNYSFEASEIDLSGIDAEHVHFAFHYLSNGSAGGDGRIWQVDNIGLRGIYKGAVIEGSELANGVPTSWTNASVKSDANWEGGNKLDIAGVFINGFGADGASEDWLIMPAVELADDDMASLKFDYYQKYSGPALKIMVSSDYKDGAEPESASWSEIDVHMPALHDAWQAVGPVSLAGLSGKQHLAFVYSTTGTGPGDGASMGLANIEILRNLDNVVQETEIVEENFDALDSLGQFSAFSKASDANWAVATLADERGAAANGYNADEASDDWLISPELQILNWHNGLIRFDIYTKYGGPALEVKISNNYSGKGDPSAEGVSWTTLDFDMSAASDDAWNSYELSVAPFTGKAYIAFHYTTTGTGSGEGRILGVDNFQYISSYGELGLAASFSAGKSDYTTIEQVSFSASVSGGEQPYSYSWDFGDGNSSSEAAPLHSYNSAGTYSVKLTVSDAAGKQFEFERKDLIKVVQSTEEVVPEQLGDVRVASFNAYLNRASEGQILADAQSGDDEQIKKVAEIIQRVRPDVLLINEFDYVADGSAVQALKSNYLEVAQQEGLEGIVYEYVYLAESNTGIVSEFDFDNNGKAGSGGGDAYGFGEFPGQYAMALLSRYPIVSDEVRSFQHFLWKDMPSAELPFDPETMQEWYSDEELAVFRLSSKSHWDVPIDVNGQILHVLASHPTPPVFDGDEDRNGLRNHDEIVFWRDYVDPNSSDYIYDDKGTKGGLGADKRFVIMGDLNASTDEGDASKDPIAKLFASDYINGSVEPTSAGGQENSPDNEFAPMHTADWAMRADYVIPSVYGIQVEQTAVYWPASSDVNYDLVGPGVQSSDHRLVWLDATLSGTDDDSDKDGDSGNDDDSDKDGDSGNDDDSDKDGDSGNDDDSDKDGDSGNDDDSDKDGDSGNDSDSDKDDDDDNDWLGSFNYTFILFAALLGLGRRFIGKLS
ncbi:choice-of-anchor J domain-containing protein [Agaribacterium haliotis]|uniref:choice-of-anchor J domain-containing protein n=1 Tax=Agaribacterium haliotis TaxID=2013869 RepID=UPI0011780B1A|nr:choice-of-anchor J domain-containing protein [Agaribacterium haliotis]